MKGCDIFTQQLSGSDVLLNVGAGGVVYEDKHSPLFRDKGATVYTNDLCYSDDDNHIQAHFPELPVFYKHMFSALWSSHTLEHVPDPGMFIRGIDQYTSDNALIGIVVPPMKPELVGGHLSLWTPGSIVYNFIINGFDCSKARVGVAGYNIYLVMRKNMITNMPTLKYDCGDIETLSQYFPVHVYQNIDGWKVVTE